MEETHEQGKMEGETQTHSLMVQLQIFFVHELTTFQVLQSS